MRHFEIAVRREVRVAVEERGRHGRGRFHRGDAAEPWILSQKFTSSDLEENDHFGYRLETNGLELIVGATFKNSPVRGIDAGFAYRYAVYALGGTLSGMRISKVRCVNPSSSGGEAPANVEVDRFQVWDCSEGTFDAAPGERVLQTFTGPALRATVSGTIGGMQGVRLVCDNLTTGDSVSIALHGSLQWSCRDAGLAPSHGDRLRVKVSGIVGTR